MPTFLFSFSFSPSPFLLLLLLFSLSLSLSLSFSFSFSFLFFFSTIVFPAGPFSPHVHPPRHASLFLNAQSASCENGCEQTQLQQAHPLERPPQETSDRTHNVSEAFSRVFTPMHARARSSALLYPFVPAVCSCSQIQPSTLYKICSYCLAVLVLSSSVFSLLPSPFHSFSF